MHTTLLLLLLAGSATSPPSTVNRQLSTEGWPAYAGDAGGTHYSSLAQIDRGNVAKLRVAWTYRTGALKPESDLNEKAAFEATPLMLDGTLYFTTQFSEVIALDAATGTERWKFDPKIDRARGYSEVTSRGVAAWRDRRAPKACALRIFVGTLDARLIALDGATGRPCTGFGREGQVDLKHGVNGAETGNYQVTSPPAIIGDLLVVGSSIGDNGRVEMERGVVRAFDVRSGALRWSFDPLSPMAPHGKSGAANAWAVISADPLLGLVYVPTSSPSPDYFGGLRPGDNRYANSVVAIEAKSGKVVWHFQVVHHDLWDYDIASQPVLVTIGSGKSAVPAIAVTTKIGHLFVLDRRNGKPLLPVEERKVPASDVEGEVAAATQPFPRNPALVPQRVGEADAWGPTEADREACRATIASLRNEGVFTPPSLRGTLVVPGNVGGVAWGGASHDPKRGLLFVNTNRLPFLVKLIPRDEYAGARKKAQESRLTGEFAPQRGAAYGMYREPLLSPKRLPCIAPPWGTLAAIDLATGEKRWEVPLGRMHLPAGAAGNGKELTIDGLPSLGGSLVTAGGLLFISATLWDDTLRAFDTDTGKVLWETKLPAGGQASPMTYAVGGRQYVVIAAGGHGKAKTTLGDSVIAFTLEK